MKGIYLTPECKQEIETEIQLLLKRHKEESESCKPIEAVLYTIKSKIYTYRDILSSAIVLPVEESWIDIGEKHGAFYEDDAKVLSDYFSQGVIIQPKQ